MFFKNFAYKLKIKEVRRFFVGGVCRTWVCPDHSLSCVLIYPGKYFYNSDKLKLENSQLLYYEAFEVI